MMSRTFRDPITRVVVLLWLGLAMLYFLPGISPDLLARLGDRYSTLPLWPWAAAACLVGVAGIRNAADRRFWMLQGFSFIALLAIEIPWAVTRKSNTVVWNIAAEACYFAYYGCQLASVAQTPAGRIRAWIACALFAVGLSVLALTTWPVYAAAHASYLTYLLFDASMAMAFWRARTRMSGAWSPIFTGLALTSALVLATDALDWLSYVGTLNLVAGMRSDILWTLPPLCYAVVARFGRQRLAAAR